MVTWSCGHVVKWSSGHVVTWSRGHVVMWSRGHVVTWVTCYPAGGAVSGLPFLSMMRVIPGWERKATRGRHSAVGVGDDGRGKVVVGS